MNIGMILDGPFPPDPRVKNEALTLIEAGHAVFLFCLDFEGKRPAVETVDGIEVRRETLHPIWRRISALAYTFSWYHTYLRPRIRSFVARNHIDVVHIHDIQIVGPAQEIATAAGLPTVLDLHENRPEIMKEYSHVQSLLGRLLIHPSRWKLAESEGIRRADTTIVVTEESRASYKEDLRESAQKIVVVPNTVRREFYESHTLDESILSKYRDRFTLLYLGDTGIRRGLLTVLESLKMLADEIPNLKLVVVGSSRSDATLQDYANSEGLGEWVDFAGWQDVNTFPSYIVASDIGLCPIHRNLHHDTTYANKIFQCLAFGRPMVVSDCPAQANLITQNRCGLVFKDQDPRDLAKQVLRLYRDEALREKLGTSGARAIRETLNWETTSQDLVALYQHPPWPSSV